MPATTAMHGYGTGVFCYDYAEITGSVPALVNPVEMPEVISVDLGGFEIGRVQATHLKSPDRWREYVPGFKDAKTISLKQNYSETNRSLVRNQSPFVLALDPPAQGRKLWQVVMPDGSYFLSVGFVATISDSVPEDDRITFQTEIQMSGIALFIIA